MIRARLLDDTAKLTIKIQITSIYLGNSIFDVFPVIVFSNWGLFLWRGIGREPLFEGCLMHRQLKMKFHSRTVNDLCMLDVNIVKRDALSEKNSWPYNSQISNHITFFYVCVMTHVYFRI